MASAAHRTRRQLVVYFVARLVCRLLWIVCFHFRLRGRRAIPGEGGGLICSNHQSMFDPVVVGLCVDRRLNYLARKTLFDHRAFASLIRFLDAIPIERDGLGLAGSKETIRRLNRGEPPLVFTLGMLIAGFLVLSVFGAGSIAATDFSSLPPLVWLTIAYLTIFASATTFFLLQYAALHLKSAKVMAYTYLVPAWVILWEVALGGAMVPLTVLIGVAAVVVALVMLLEE